MANHVTGISTPPCVPLPCLGELRQQVLAALVGNPLFTAAEQLRANHFAHECEDAARLIRWQVSVQAEITRREQAAARRRGQQALRATLSQLQPSEGDYRHHHPRKRRPAPAWVPGAPLPDQADRRAGTFDRRTAAHFQPADSLTLAHLLARPRP